METHSKKVCAMCGVVGFTEDIVTCCQCNQISEHIYCMDKQPDFVRENWRCEGCLAYNQDSPSVCSKFYTRRFPSSRSSLSSCEEKWSQIRDKQHIGTHGSQHGKEFSSKVPDMGNEKSCTSVSHGRPLRSSSKMVKNAKVQYIPEEELTTSQAKASLSLDRPSLGASLSLTNQEEVMHACISGRTSRDIPLIASSNETKYQQKLGSATPDVQVSFLKSPLKNVVTVKEEKLQDYNASGKGLGPICKKVKWDDSVSSKPYQHRSKISPTESMSNYASPPIPNDNGRKRLFTKASVPIKEELIEECTQAGSKDIQFLKSKYALATTLPTKGAAYDQGSNMFFGNTMRSVSQFSEVAYHDPPSALLIVSNGERPTKELLWMGTFEVVGSVSFIYEGIEAHIGSNVSPKAYNTLSQLPKRIKFKLVPRQDVWPRAFRSNPPDTDDVALYFFPSEFHRSKENYIYLLDGIDQSDLAMHSCIGDVELLIFSSKQLPKVSLGTSLETFLWGVFRHKKQKKENLHDRGKISAQTNIVSVERREPTIEQIHVDYVDACRQPIKLEAIPEVTMKERVDHTYSRTNLSPKKASRFDMVPTTGNRSVPPWDIPPGFSERYISRVDCEKKLHAHETLTSPTKSREQIPRWDTHPSFREPYISRVDFEKKPHANAKLTSPTISQRSISGWDIPPGFSEEYIRRVEREKTPHAHAKLASPTKSQGPVPEWDIPPGFESYIRRMEREKAPHAYGMLTNPTKSEGPPGILKPCSGRNDSSSLPGVSTSPTFSGKDTNSHMSPSPRVGFVMRDVPASQTSRQHR